MDANAEKAQGYVAWSLSMVTSLAPVIGYDKASKIAKRAIEEKKTVRDLCEELDVLPAAGRHTNVCALSPLTRA